MITKMLNIHAVCLFLRKIINMIVLRIFGGLGNQLFQYAFGRKLSILKKEELFLDNYSGFFEDFYNRAYQLNKFNIIERIADESNIPKFFFHHTESVHLKGKIIRKLNLIFPYNKRRVLIEKGKGFNPIYLDVSKTYDYFIGYWQSFKYFDDIKDILQSEFEIKNELDEKNLNLVDKIRSSNSVGVHFRKLYGFSNGKILKKHINVHGILSLEYYIKAIKYLNERIPNLHLFLFSDDHEWVKENINLSIPYTLVSHNDSSKNIEDLKLMSICKYNIIANSSFSWWAGWLNKDPKKIVIAPQKWYNNFSYSSSDLLPDEWIKL